MNYFLTVKYLFLYRSLKRYFEYVLQCPLEFLDIEREVVGPEIRIFIYEDEKHYDRILQKINNIGKCEIIVLGFSEDSEVNLVDNKELKNSLLSVLNKKPSGNLSEVMRLNDKIQRFFKGHGEESLLSCLGLALGYFNNFNSLSATGEYNQEGLQIHFLNPGINSWRNFTGRFFK